MWDRPSAATTSGPVDEVRAGADERLVEGLRRGAPDAFADLHERYAPGIYNLALRMVRRGEDAEDITQDVLIRAFERVPREREVVLRPWLYRLTVNRCYDHLRAAKRRGVTGHRDEQGLVAPGDPFEQAAQGRLLEAALRGLTRRQRAALLLKDVHGLTTLEVASALELTPGSVEVLLARSRNAFRTSYVRLCRAEDMPTPSTAGAVLGLLPQLPLPVSLKTALQTSLKTPTALAPSGPGLLPAIDLAAGSLGAALSTSTVAKVAAALLAAATIAGAGPAGPRRSNERPPRDRQVVAVAERMPAHGPPVSSSESVGPAVASPSPARDRAAASATPAAPSPDSSPAASASPSPEPSSTPLGAQLITPSPTSSPAPTSAPTPTPTPSATSTPSTAPSATPSSSPSTD